MTLNEFWRSEYRNNRYMERLEHEKLEQRFRDVFSNMLLLTPERKIGLKQIHQGGGYLSDADGVME